ncbi:OmpA family protein [Neptuniibacter sp.]|uniref:flagellar protein MotY n=1 Tax=Neptuniibacter sp. TaxID=1962643 RepID=UPI002614337E|nr:OmpA family protein [Neptuniibacter sp.]MCP4598283.1 OmpA family protein [Neptuniibacter sp.]
MFQRFTVAVFFTLFAIGLQAATFRSSIDDSKWELEASKFSCRLSQVIPSFGNAVFEHEAGESVRFVLKPTENIHFQKGAQLVAEAAPWQPGVTPRKITAVKPEHLSGDLNVETKHAQNMLAALYKGMMPTFTASQWYGTNESLRVSVSAVNFQSAYTDYVACTAGLLPVNYRQVARTAILFPSAAWRLSDSSRERLELIGLYVKNDDSVKGIYVDGHSDNMGRRLMNRDLSKRRAEEVTAYLINLGLDPNMITTRYHGERYPVVKNNNKENRDRNRRVTIRLEKD